MPRPGGPGRLPSSADACPGGCSSAIAGRALAGCGSAGRGLGVRSLPSSITCHTHGGCLGWPQQEGCSGQHASVLGAGCGTIHTRQAPAGVGKAQHRHVPRLFRRTASILHTDKAAQAPDAHPELAVGAIATHSTRRVAAMPSAATAPGRLSYRCRHKHAEQHYLACLPGPRDGTGQVGSKGKHTVQQLRVPLALTAFSPAATSAGLPRSLTAWTAAAQSLACGCTSLLSPRDLHGAGLPVLTLLGKTAVVCTLPYHACKALSAEGSVRAQVQLTRVGRAPRSVEGARDV